MIFSFSRSTVGLVSKYNPQANIAMRTSTVGDDIEVHKARE